MITISHLRSSMKPCREGNIFRIFERRKISPITPSWEDSNRLLEPGLVFILNELCQGNGLTLSYGEAFLKLRKGLASPETEMLCLGVGRLEMNKNSSPIQVLHKCGEAGVTGAQQERGGSNLHSHYAQVHGVT